MKYLKLLFCSLFLFFVSSVNFVAFASDVKPDLYAKVVLVGDYACGKTALVRKLFGMLFDPNLGASNEMVMTPMHKRIHEHSDDEKLIQFSIWDSAGARQYRKEVIKFLGGISGVTEAANFVIVVHDLSSECTDEHYNYLANLCFDVRKANPNARLILVGTKWDLRHDSPEAIRNFTGNKVRLDALAKVLGCDFFTTSAKENVPDGPGKIDSVGYMLARMVACCDNMELYDHNPDTCLSPFRIPGGWWPCTIQ